MAGSPKVWSKFSTKTKDGTVLNLRIVDMPKSLSEKVINLYMNHFVKEENTIIASGVPQSTEAMEELKGLILGAVNEEKFHIVICCLDNDDDQIKEVFGASMMSLTSKEGPQPEFDIKTDEVKKLFEMMYGLEAYYNEIKEFDLDLCFTDRGVCVCPEYRGLGIAQELLKVRRLICKDHGIPINGAWMTSYGTQKAAERDGWETVFEIPFEELGKNLGVTFRKEPPTSKFMIARIQ